MKAKNLELRDQLSKNKADAEMVQSANAKKDLQDTKATQLSEQLKLMETQLGTA